MGRKFRGGDQIIDSDNGGVSGFLYIGSTISIVFMILFLIYYIIPAVKRIIRNFRCMGVKTVDDHDKYCCI
jgi:hypothetical protein